MSETNAFMDYKNIYDLFLGKLSLDNAPKSKRKDIIPEIGVMKEMLIEDSWRDVPFSLVAAGYYEVGDRHVTDRRDVESFEAIDTVAGRGIINIDGREFECLPNTVLLLDCRVHHTFRVKKGETWTYKHLHFLANDSALCVAEKASMILTKDMGIINDRFDDILNELHSVKTSTHYLLSNWISDILTHIICFEFKSSFTDPQERVVNRAVEYIQNHYGEKITVEQLAGDAFISTYHFIRLFKKYHGVPPYSYLNDYRLKMAQYMFLQKMRIKDVAEKCGFSNTNSFTRAFQKRFGVLPSKYRESVVGQLSSDRVNGEPEEDAKREDEQETPGEQSFEGR